jgi:hypothetical protein
MRKSRRPTNTAMEQVRKVCAEAGPGQMPDIPEFLRRNPDNTGGAKDWSKPTPQEPSQVPTPETAPAK